MDTDGHGRDDLVEPEGVNAGSAKSSAEATPPTSGDPTLGGHPERAAEQADPDDSAEVVDAPFEPRDPAAPSLEQSIEEGAAPGSARDDQT